LKPVPCANDVPGHPDASAGIDVQRAPDGVRMLARVAGIVIAWLAEMAG